jgi:hypothetical protein
VTATQIIVTAFLILCGAAARHPRLKDDKWQSRLFFMVVMSGGVSGLLQFCQSRTTQLALTGDRTRPPYYDVIPVDESALDPNTRQVTTRRTIGREEIRNDSGYSHYGVSLRLKILGRNASETRGVNFSVPQEVVPNGTAFQGTHAHLENLVPMNIEIEISCRARSFL